MNQFDARFDTFDLNKEVAHERMELNLSENVDEWLVISENKTRKEFFNVNANKTKDPDGLTGTFLKTNASQPCYIFYIFHLSLYINFLDARQSENFKNNPCP